MHIHRYTQTHTCLCRHTTSTFQCNLCHCQFHSHHKPPEWTDARPIPRDAGLDGDTPDPHFPLAFIARPGWGRWPLRYPLSSLREARTYLLAAWAWAGSGHHCGPRHRSNLWGEAQGHSPNALQTAIMEPRPAGEIRGPVKELGEPARPPGRPFPGCQGHQGRNCQRGEPAGNQSAWEGRWTTHTPVDLSLKGNAAQAGKKGGPSPLGPLLLSFPHCWPSVPPEPPAKKTCTLGGATASIGTHPRIPLTPPPGFLGRSSFGHH